ncbi:MULTISPECIES: acetolactate synthase small subunit [Micromonospora]|jgi:acetolactate synthase I/III small subunit|uniref:Acetolactate synthase small subunit n=2 Tax=Micromonospora TaxID=1873 RepID=A0A1C4UYN3_9ACTN|nr:MULTISPECIES: acetolactate synthase small subunit [Micromonospora]WSZ88151.1 acetolactate synthase small subunit [Micromonospora sp. NBC_00858]MBQ0900622.1 acetolactate synthase small subunit [Micromonospora sp. U21]RLP93663.1 acetolactate synthase small subunit [Micromonospora sp. BL4]RLP98361.1 acetolactate synthase small subunit [Micromonospora sp. CV4]TNH25484.1 acetolactate synthase small subunit [Micromonospora orduensis]
MTMHTLSVLVENKPGVLARVSGLFSRRGFNIDSLAVGETENPDVSRITIVVNAESSPLEQVTKQLNKLVNVLKIVELDPQVSVARELLLVKVRADRSARTQVLETVNLFRARVVDVAPDTLTIEATGTPDKLDALLRDLEPFGIKEMVQSGLVAIGRGSRSITAGPALRAA